MTELSGAFERSGAAFLLFALAATTLSRLGSLKVRLFWSGAITGALCLVPLWGLSPLNYVYSAVGPLSSASLVLLAIISAEQMHRDGRIWERSGAPVLACLLLAVSIPFYAFSIGLGPWDPYRLGYASPILVAPLLFSLALGWWAATPAIFLWLIAGTSLFLLQAYKTSNLVDYLIDPVAVVISIWAALMMIRRTFRRSVQQHREG